MINALYILIITISLSANALAGPYACPNGKSYRVTLTFDDGPNLTLTPKVLDILKKNNIPATFFVLAEHFERDSSSDKYYKLLDRIKKEGHYIGSHTLHHVDHTKLTPQDAEADIQQAKNLLGGFSDPILRLPYGAGAFYSSDPFKQSRNDEVMAMVRDNGYRHVLWDIDTNDWDPMVRPHLVPSMMREICEAEGGIILMHDIQSYTVENLQQWINIIRSEGHQIVGLENFVQIDRNLQYVKKSKPNKNKTNDCVDCSRRPQQKDRAIGNIFEWIKKIGK